MRKRSTVTAVLATAALLGMGAMASAATIASDNAANSPYSDGWQTGDNGGTGWGGGWTLDLNGDGSQTGHFVGDSTTNGDGDTTSPTGDINTSGKAWAMYANGGKTAGAARPLNGALTVGQSISLNMDNGWIDSPTDLFGLGTVGFSLRNSSGENVWEFFFKGGDSTYTVNAGSATGGTLPGFTDEGLSINFTLTSATTYSADVAVLGGTPVTVTGNLFAPTNGTAISDIRLFNYNGGSGGPHNAFFNNLSVVPEPASLGLLGMAGAFVMSRRRRR